MLPRNMRKRPTPLRFIHARLDLACAEKNIALKEARKAKRTPTATFRFAMLHKLSLDWLYFGDLRAKFAWDREIAA